MTDPNLNPDPDFDGLVDGPADEPTTLAELFTFERAKKAYSAGAAAGVLAVGTAVGPVLADGKIEGPEVAVLAGGFVVAFVGGFFAAWLPANRKHAA